ncbi:hypothetical protein Tco_0530593 [Tanacetum coccineum]
MVNGDKPPKNKESGSTLSEYYHKFNALWRQYYLLVNLPGCICENSEKSIILTTDHIPDVKGSFATLSRDESIGVLNLITCFELVGYPPNFNRNNGFNKGAASNNAVTRNKDQPASNSFSDDQYKRLIALISEKSGSVVYLQTLQGFFSLVFRVDPVVGLLLRLVWGIGFKEKIVNALNLEVVKDGVVPSVTVASGSTQVKNMGQSSTGPSLPTQETTLAGNAPGKSSYANVTGKPIGKKLNFRTLYTPGGNGINVVVLVESIKAISERFDNSAYGFFLGKRVVYPVVANYVRNT